MNAEGGEVLKRRFWILAALVIFVLTMTAYAVEPHVVSARPVLSFQGTTAFCGAECRAENSSDTVKATLTLYRGSTYVDSWSGSGKGRVAISGDCAVKSGTKYTLTLTYSINGIAQPSVSTTATCP